jgi:membrane dipeptidase
VDGHNDLPLLIRRATGGDVRAYGLDERRPGRDTDIPRLREGLVAGQFWAAFVPPRETRPTGYALQQIALIHRLAETHPETFFPARESADVARARTRAKIASFCAIENGAAIELDRLDAIVTLCHNLTTDWCDSATDQPRHAGLAPFGRRAIERMNRLGVLVDLSHTSEQAALQAIEISATPPILSHSNARALCDHPRNATDALLDRLRQAEGLVMATFVPNFLSSGWSRPGDGDRPRGGVADLCDHLDYLRGRIGEDHIGLGSDFFGGPQGPGLEDASCFPAIFAELLRREWSEEALAKLAGGNLLRVFATAERVAREG